LAFSGSFLYSSLYPTGTEIPGQVIREETGITFPLLIDEQDAL
jgi:hypothetical protein